MGRRSIPSSTIKVLYGKSGNLCAFPNCLKPNIDDDTNENLSQIAHIKGYSATGPRFDRNLGDADKNHVDNLLILCREHHREIDFENPDNYSVEDLKKMRQEHESKVLTYYEISKEGLQDVINNLKNEIIEKNELVEKNYNKIADLSSRNQEYKLYCDNFLTGFIDLLEELFPLQLPGIQHGRLEQPFEDIPKHIIDSIRDKCDNTKLINEDGSPVDICLDLKNNWKAQRVWFMIGNFWFYDLQDEKAFYHYDFLKDIEIVINDKTGEPSITEKVFYFNYAYTIGRRGNHEEEIILYNKVTELEPKNFKAWYNKSFAQDKLARYEESLVSANKAIEINPLYNHGWYAKGVAYMSLKEYEKAAQAFSMTIMIDPKYYEAYPNLGGMYGLMGDYKKEIQIYDQMISFKSDLSDVWHNRGTALAKLNRFKSALASFDVALDIEPNKYDSLHNKAFALLKLNRLEEASEWYEKAIDVDARLMTLNDLAATYNQLGNNDDAKIIFEKLLIRIKKGITDMEDEERVRLFLENILRFSQKNNFDDLLVEVSNLYAELFPNSEISQ